LNRKPINEWDEAEFYQTGEQDARRFVDVFCKQHGIRTARRVCLEIGCGAGRVTWALANRFQRVIGIDVSDEMLDFARERVKARNVEFVRGSGVDLNVIDTNGVSFVFSTMVFQHIPDTGVQYNLLREVARVLRPGGYFFIHLYADKAGYERKKANWEKRAAAQELMGWTEAAKVELEDENYKTSMCTPVDDATVRALLDEVGIDIVWESGANTSAWNIGGKVRK